MNKSLISRGFTLIELLVVIAIIGILAAVVLSSLNDARSSGSDASAKQSLNNLRSQSEIYYNANNYTYEVANATDSVCLSTQGQALLNAALNNTPATSLVTAGTLQVATTVNCYDTANAWAASAPMSGGDYFCVDSTGFGGARTSPLAANTAQCPAS